MAFYSDPKCSQCPYLNNNHLQGTNFFTLSSGPLSIDLGNRSKTLLVFQAPGVTEWSTRKPLQASGNSTSSAGVRIHNSWARTGKARSDFDITNSVQCFPDKYGNGRDKRPRKHAINKCLEWLKEDIKTGRYTKIITFGRIAQDQVNQAISHLGLNGKLTVIHSKHPSGGVSNKSLDDLW